MIPLINMPKHKGSLAGSDGSSWLATDGSVAIHLKNTFTTPIMSAQQANITIVFVSKRFVSTSLEKKCPSSAKRYIRNGLQGLMVWAGNKTRFSSLKVGSCSIELVVQ